MCIIRGKMIFCVLFRCIVIILLFDCIVIFFNIDIFFFVGRILIKFCLEVIVENLFSNNSFIIKIII